MLVLPPHGALPYKDTSGTLLLLGMLGSFLLSSICFLFTESMDSYSHKMGRAFVLLLGTGFICWGLWMFGDKTRFASHSVDDYL